MTSPLVFAGFVLAVAVSWLVKRAAILDHPNQRSSHSKPVPRSGGFGVLAAIGFGLLLAAMNSDGPAVLPLALAGVGFGILGFWDDLAAPATILKFAIIVVLAAGIVWLAGPVEAIGLLGDTAFALPFVVGLVGSVLWIFVAANATNFMDGSDGLIVAVFLPVGLGLALIGDGAVATVGLMLAAGLVGFAVFNVPRAVLFLGDVGSLSIGAVFAVAALLLIEAPGQVWLFPLMILPVLTDVLLTLVGKLRHRIGFLAPHRTHAYQLLIRMGWAHWQVALGFLILSSVCTGVTCWMYESETHALALPVFIAAVIVLSGLHATVRLKASRQGLLKP
ncbi:glycosyltransferase family 4 protein [Hyphobacterium sp.]|uniref:glycosyltransferase family 4 protein n=1 Tax=Hyphobacterium sp. TaxID=2004662 RepID=UPI003BAAD6CA